MREAEVLRRAADEVEEFDRGARSEHDALHCILLARHLRRLADAADAA